MVRITRRLWREDVPRSGCHRLDQRLCGDVSLLQSVGPGPSALHVPFVGDWDNLYDLLVSIYGQEFQISLFAKPCLSVGAS